MRQQHANLISGGLLCKEAEFYRVRHRHYHEGEEVTRVQQPRCYCHAVIIASKVHHVLPKGFVQCGHKSAKGIFHCKLNHGAT